MQDRNNAEPGSQVICPVCDHKLNSRNSLRSHIRNRIKYAKDLVHIKYEQERKNFVKCPICDFKAATEKVIRRHLIQFNDENHQNFINKHKEMSIVAYLKGIEEINKLVQRDDFYFDKKWILRLARKEKFKKCPVCCNFFSSYNGIYVHINKAKDDKHINFVKQHLIMILKGFKEIKSPFEIKNENKQFFFTQTWIRERWKEYYSKEELQKYHTEISSKHTTLRHREGKFDYSHLVKWRNSLTKKDWLQIRYKQLKTLQKIKIFGSLNENRCYELLQQKINHKIIHHDIDLYKGKEYDMTIHDLKVAIEWDGLFHYSSPIKNIEKQINRTKISDKQKNTRIKNIGWKIIRIKGLKNTFKFVQEKVEEIVEILKKIEESKIINYLIYI